MKNIPSDARYVFFFFFWQILIFNINFSSADPPLFGHECCEHFVSPFESGGAVGSGGDSWRWRGFLATFSMAMSDSYD